MMMSYNEIIEHLKEELRAEYIKLTMNQENHYSYIWMICNDIGITLD